MRGQGRRLLCCRAGTSRPSRGVIRSFKAARLIAAVGVPSLPKIGTPMPPMRSTTTSSSSEWPRARASPISPSEQRAIDPRIACCERRHDFGQHDGGLVLRQPGQQRHAAGADAERTTAADVQVVGADRIGPELAVDADRFVAVAGRQDDRVARSGSPACTSLGRARLRMWSRPLHGDAQHQRFVAERDRRLVTASRSTKPSCDQRLQQAQRRRLVQRRCCARCRPGAAVAVSTARAGCGRPSAPTAVGSRRHQLRERADRVGTIIRPSPPASPANRRRPAAAAAAPSAGSAIAPVRAQPGRQRASGARSRPGARRA